MEATEILKASTLERRKQKAKQSNKSLIRTVKGFGFRAFLLNPKPSGSYDNE